LETEAPDEPAVPPSQGGLGLTATASRSAALTLVRRVLAEGGIEEAALDARLLTVEALGIAALDLLLGAEKPIGEAGAERLSAMTARRLAREPVARILGLRGFWGLPFRLSPDTLVPRPDTETLVEAALDGFADRTAPLRILDLGTGSGCVLVALLHELPAAWGVGVDLAPGALATARDNALLNGVGDRAAFVASEWASAIDARFELIISNPPYIRAADIETLEPEVARHDPRGALDGGPDGLAAYRAILAEAYRLLAAPGRLILEIGHDQADSVASLAMAAGFPPPELIRDLGGNPRVLAFSPFA
jgi:release factor glutamine methyltransferase